MIIKNFELNKINLKINKIFLLYGENQGAKDELIESIIDQKKSQPINIMKKTS